MPNGNVADREALATIRETLGDTVADDLEDLRRKALDSARACRIEEAVDYLGLLVDRTARLRGMTFEPKTEDYRDIYEAATEYEAITLTDFAEALVRECGCRRPGVEGNHRPVHPVELE